MRKPGLLPADTIALLQTPQRLETATPWRTTSLAESLGATVVRVKADRSADGLIAFAKREEITHVIFGQSARTRLTR